MTQAATARLKVEPMRGMRPSLEFRPIPDLHIDPTYQRSIDTGPSQTLIRRIAVHWDWGLCQPLTVAKREDGSLYVIDGQHRLAAARARRDIYDLPCVVVPSLSPGDEAACFVAMNQQRRPLSKIDVFKAALAAGDEDAIIIRGSLDAAGLSIAKNTNPDFWKPGEIVNVGGLERCYRKHGPGVLRTACAIAAKAFEGQVLRYFGTIFPGIVAAVVELPKPINPDDVTLVAEVLGGGTQADWRDDINRAKAANPDANMRRAAEIAIVAAIAEAMED